MSDPKDKIKITSPSIDGPPRKVREMILCFGNDDLDIIQKGYEQGKTRRGPPTVFGIAYCYIVAPHDRAPPQQGQGWRGATDADPAHPYKGLLGKEENLFITAHGNDEEIGNKGAGVSLKPGQLAKILIEEILPEGYAGSIYVSACDTAPKYSTNLKEALGTRVGAGVYGCVGDVDLDIAPPGDRMWTRAS